MVENEEVYSYFNRPRQGVEATLLKCIPGEKLPKYTYTLMHFNSPGNVSLFFCNNLNEIVTLLQLHCNLHFKNTYDRVKFDYFWDKKAFNIRKPSK